MDTIQEPDTSNTSKEPSPNANKKIQVNMRDIPETNKPQHKTQVRKPRKLPASNTPIIKIQEQVYVGKVGQHVAYYIGKELQSIHKITKIEKKGYRVLRNNEATSTRLSRTEPVIKTTYSKVLAWEIDDEYTLIPKKDYSRHEIDNRKFRIKILTKKRAEALKKAHQLIDQLS